MKGYLIKDKQGKMVGTKCKSDGAVILAFFEYLKDAKKELKHAPKGSTIEKAEVFLDTSLPNPL